MLSGFEFGNALFIFVQVAIVAAAIYLAFGLRRQLGLTGIYLVVGSLQALATMAAVAVRVKIWDGFLINPGGTVIFMGVLLIVLLIYVVEDANEAKRIIYGLLIASAAVGLLLMTLSVQSGPEGSGALQRAGEILIFGTLVLWADTLLLILSFDGIARIGIRRPALRAWLCMSIVAVLDAAMISWFVYSGATAFRSFAALLIGKLIVTVPYSFLFAAIVGQQRTFAFNTERLSMIDLFQALTWRDRYEMLALSAVRDGLTGVFNRNYFDREASIQAERAALRGESFALLMLDLDDFKKINDTHGHTAGDAVLRVLGEALRAVARQNDTVCRYGGEEFAVLVAGAGQSLETSLYGRFSDEFRERFLAAHPPFGFAPPTFSMGGARFPEDGSSVAAVLNAADRRLYEAKRAGKNRLVAF